MTAEHELAGGGAPEPRPAATLVVARDGARGVEVLLTERPKALRFMGGATVFPGGAVSRGDLDPSWDEHSVLSADEAASRLDADDERAALGAFVCALREAYEEVGLLLCAAAPAEPPSRSAAGDGSAFLEGVRNAGAVLATDALVPAGRWVTPLGSPIRFDARFFVTRAPHGWEPDPDPHEVAGCRWSTPAEALTELASGRAVMAPPTVEMLQRLDGFASVEEMLSGVSTRGLRGAGHVLSVRLSPFVHVVLAPNAGVMTGPGTNTYIVGAPGEATLVVDPAVDDEEYLSAVLEVAEPVHGIVVTHRHADHVGGVAELHRRTGATVRAWGPQPAGGEQPVPLAEGEVLRAGGARLEVIHAPGHASDHVCLYMPGVASLFAGDNILGEGTAVIAPPDGDMIAFMGTLRRLSELHLDRIYPGHFKPLDGGTQVIRSLIRHREEREAKILSAVRAGAADLDEIVARAYEDTPSSLHPVARFSTAAHLAKLEQEGAVAGDGTSWRVVDAG